MNHKYHVDGSPPQYHQIFVFGSNLSGIHGAGAAWAARMHYGAILGQAEGRQGRSYALPTVREKIRGPLPVQTIKKYVNNFLQYANQNPDEEFFVTAVGCTLAGHRHADIAVMFKDAPKNCSLPDVWKIYLEPQF